MQSKTKNKETHMTQQSMVESMYMKNKQMRKPELKIKHIFMSVNKNKTFNSEINADSIKIYKTNLKQKISKKIS